MAQKGEGEDRKKAFVSLECLHCFIIGFDPCLTKQGSPPDEACAFLERRGKATGYYTHLGSVLQGFWAIGPKKKETDRMLILCQKEYQFLCPNGFCGEIAEGMHR
jgi:hypothetical protein